MLAFRWVSDSNQLYRDRAVFASPNGQRALIMIYKRNGLDVSRLFFVPDAPPNQKSLIALARSHEPELVVWSADGSVVATTGNGRDDYDEAYDFRSRQTIRERTDSPQKYRQRQQQIAALLKQRGGVAAPAARRNYPITKAEQDQWRAIDPEMR